MTDDSPQVGRRRIVRGAAWAVPGVALAAQAPAYAASCPNPCPTLDFGVPGAGNTTAGNGWSYALTGGTFGTNNSHLGFYNNGLTASPTSIPTGTTYFGCDRNILFGAPTLTLTQNGQNGLTGRCSARISVDIVYWAVTFASADATLEIYVGATAVGSFDTGGFNQGTNTSTSYSVTTTAAGSISFRLSWPNVSAGDDLFIYNPRVVCTG